MIYAIKIKVEVKDLHETEDLQSKIEQVRLIEKLGKQGFRYDIIELFEPITKTVRDSNQKIFEETETVYLIFQSI